MKAWMYSGIALGVACIVAAHIWRGNRRVVFSALLAVVLSAAAAPHLQRMWPGGPVARVTINWPDILLMVMWGVVLTPASGRRLRVAITDSDFDHAVPTSPAPLRAVNSSDD